MPPPDSNVTVFVIDDEAMIRDSLAAVLELSNLPVQCFASAEDFLEDFDRQRTGCLVLDVRLGGMSGFELWAELDREGVHLPIIFITGHSPAVPEQVQKDVVAVFLKPFHPRDLVEAIHRALDAGIASTVE